MAMVFLEVCRRHEDNESCLVTVSILILLFGWRLFRLHVPHNDVIPIDVAMAVALTDVQRSN